MVPNERRSGGWPLAIATALVIPVVGAILLGFYLSGPSEEEVARAASLSSEAETASSIGTKPQMIIDGPRPTASPVPMTPTASILQITALPSVTPTPTEIPTPTVTPTPEPTETIPPPRTVQPETVAIVTAEDGLNVREGASTEFDVVGVLRFEEEVVLTGESLIEGEMQWVEIQGQGWVQARYLGFSD